MIELEFYSGPVARKLPDEGLAAQVIAAAWRHARRPLGGNGRAAAVTEIAGLARGSGDLLAQCAGITAGFHHGQADEGRHLLAAQLCIEAGADAAQVHRWAEKGRRPRHPPLALGKRGPGGDGSPPGDARPGPAGVRG